MSGIEQLKNDPSVDWLAFGQILEMDDDDKRETSEEIVKDALQQSKSSLDQIDAIIAEDPPFLYDLEQHIHVLKGVAHVIGAKDVLYFLDKAHTLAGRKNDAGEDSSEENNVILGRIKPLVAQAREKLTVFETKMRKFYKFDT